jgi:hypothetical protein
MTRKHKMISRQCFWYLYGHENIFGMMHGDPKEERRKTVELSLVNWRPKPPAASYCTPPGLPCWLAAEPV